MQKAVKFNSQNLFPSLLNEVGFEYCQTNGTGLRTVLVHYLGLPTDF